MTIRTGRCLCGRIRYRVTGEPSKVGICHCINCRRESGSAFVTYAIWPREAFSLTGKYATFQGRSFCPGCGSRLFNLTDTKAELRVGSLDAAPTDLVPGREIWYRRREPWLAPLAGIPQHDEDEPG